MSELGRVLTVVGDLGLGGTQRTAQNYALAYRHCGYDSAVLAYSRSGPRAQPLVEAGLRVFVPAPRCTDPVEQAVSWKPDLIHVHRAGYADSNSGQVLSRLASRRAVPVIETNVFGRPDYSRSADLIDVHAHISMWSAWRWRQMVRWRRPLAPDCLVPYACDTGRFDSSNVVDKDAFRRRNGVPADAFVVGRVGQSLEAKWSPHTVEAFRMFATGARDAWLVLLGPPTSVVKQVSSLSPSIAGRVRLLPVTASEDELVEAFTAFDIFLHSSTLGESFGMVLAESMACRTPVITLSTPRRDNGQCEVVGHGVGGIVCSDTPALVAALHQLHSDSPHRDSLGIRARNRIEDLYSLPVIERRLCAVAQALLGGPRSGIADRLSTSLDDGLERRLLASLGIDSSHPRSALIDDALSGLGPIERLRIRSLHHPAAYLARHPGGILDIIRRGHGGRDV